MTETNENVLKELLTTVKGLQAKMENLESGATGGNNPPTDQTGPATLPLNGSDARGNPRKRRLSGEELSDDEDDDGDGDDTFKLSEEGDAFIETAFKSGLDSAARGKKKAKLGLPDSKWLKSPQLDPFIASTIPKDITRADTAAEKIQRYWLDATAPLTAIIEKTDAGEIDQADAIQGIRAALVLMGNASQHHAIQRRKAILQHLNPQLKSLVKDEDFATAAPFLFGPSFREIAKERLEAAALIQKTQSKTQQNFQRRHPQKQSYWGRRGGSKGYGGPSRKGNWQAGGSKATGAGKK